MPSRDELIAGIVAAQERMRHLVAADRENALLHSTLTMQQVKVLLVLSHPPDGGRAPTGPAPAGAPTGPELSGQELAAAMGVGAATMTGIVDRLVAAGLVDRREDARDRRIRRVRLTGPGRETIDGIVNAGNAVLLSLLRRLSDAELGVVEQATRLMVDAASAELADRAR